MFRGFLAQATERGYADSLIQAERTWVAFRDATCTYEGQMGAGGGSEEGIYVLSCKEDLTKLQADRPNARLQD